MPTPPAVWGGVLRRLGTELPEFALEAWIRPLQVEEVADGLRLLAPSAFHLQRLRSAYLERIRACAAAECGRPLEIAVGLGAGLAARDLPAIPASAGRASGAPPALAAAAPAPSSPSSPPSPPAQPCLPHTFESFVVGASNRFAREASLALARGQQPHMSPLFITGDVGIGKTHLARALATEARRRVGDRVVYASAEGFTTELLTAIRERRAEVFKRRFRDCQLLVLEDVQFLGGKTATQGELFHTLEHLRLVGVPVALTADRLPGKIPDLDRRLGSTMGCGLVVEIEPPDAALRREILRRKAAAGGVRLPEECLGRLVEAVRGSVRDLEGVLIQLVATASFLRRPIDAELTEAALRKVAPETRRRELDPETVVDVVAKFHGTTRTGLSARSKKKGVLVPRQVAMYLCRRFTDASLAEIGRAVGRDRPATQNAIAAVERRILESAQLRYRVEELVARLEALESGRRCEGASP
jgi:chromosomal replication initiator protein